VYDIIVSDASNCEQKIRIEGLQRKIVQLSDEVSGYTINPKVQYKTSFDYGLKKGSKVYKYVSGSVPSTYQTLQTLIGNGSIVEISIDDVEIGDSPFIN